jgi:hypothetical protein
LPAKADLPDPPAGGGDGAGGGAGSGRALHSIESTRVYLHLTNDWLPGEYRRAAALIDADTAAVTEMLAMQETAAR